MLNRRVKKEVTVIPCFGLVTCRMELLLIEMDCKRRSILNMLNVELPFQ